MTSEAVTRCENLACLCDATLVEGTCSPYCASTEGMDPKTIVCSCGLSDCEQEGEKQLHDGGLGEP
jgi:hypothetical protein